MISQVNRKASQTEFEVASSENVKEKNKVNHNATSVQNKTNEYEMIINASNGRINLPPNFSSCMPLVIPKST